MRKTDFERIVEHAFGILEPIYGLKRIETQFRKGGVTVTFENKTTRVLLDYEIGEQPWLTLIDRQNPGNKSTLGWLLVELGIQKAPTPEQAFHPKPLENSRLEAVLQEMSTQVQQYGAEILRGDFSIFPKLQDRSSKYAQECKRYAAIHKQ